jgi:signal transduction histidine kinase
MALDFDLADVPPLAAAHEDALLRIVDEALANVLRHSGASRVLVRLRRVAERVRLVIADNGRGVVAGTDTGMGLRNMRERAQGLPGGRFGFDSQPGHGTRVDIDFLTEAAS